MVKIDSLSPARELTTAYRIGSKLPKGSRSDPELARFKNVPTIAVTTSELDGDRKRAAEMGIDEFILKPLHAEYLP